MTWAIYLSGFLVSLIYKKDLKHLKLREYYDYKANDYDYIVDFTLKKWLYSGRIKELFCKETSFIRERSKAATNIPAVLMARQLDKMCHTDSNLSYL